MRSLFFLPACTLLIGISVQVFAVDPSRLWLPSSLQKHYLGLVEAARVAEKLDRCVKVMEGTIDRDRSVPDHPIYRILCRQENGKTYNEMVDGLSYETLTTVIVKEEDLSEAERAALRAQEEARRQAIENAQKADSWKLCHGLLLQQTKLMLDLSWITELPPQPESFADGKATFIVDFDAHNMWGEALRYRAECRAELDADPQLKVFKRPN